MSKLKKEPDVDIIIPNFNKAKFLGECIQSVIQQSYSNWKLFIIDDASKDNSINILKKYENMEKITIVKLKQGALMQGYDHIIRQNMLEKDD